MKLKLPDWQIFKDLEFILAGIFGGLAKIMHRHEKPSIWDFVSSLIIGGFTAWMLKEFMISIGFDVHRNLDTIIFFCGMSGYIGPQVLDILVEVFTKSIKDNNFKCN